MDKKWLWLLLAPVLAYAAYSFGRWTTEEGVYEIKIKSEVPCIRVQVLGSRKDHNYLYVRNMHTGIEGILHSTDATSPEINTGDELPLEVWDGKGYTDYPHYVYRSDNKEYTYFQEGYDTLKGD